MMPKCQICKKEHYVEGLRLGVCWDCMTAECIIQDGVDMDDFGPKNTKEPAKTALEKLLFLYQKGLRFH